MGGVNAKAIAAVNRLYPLEVNAKDEQGRLRF